MAEPGRPQPIPRDARRIPVPAVALDRWLSEIDDSGELKVTLRVVSLLATIPGRRGVPASVSLDYLLDDEALRRARELAHDYAIRNALGRSLDRGTLIAARVGGDTRIWLNDERAAEHLTQQGLTALAGLDIAGTVEGGGEIVAVKDRDRDREGRANIFGLYERHIGTFGYGMAEQLKAAEEEYPASWIREAFEISAEQNVRSWGYVRAILRRWVHEGKPPVLTATKGAQREQRHVDGEPGHDTAPDSRTGYLESYRRRYGRLPWESNGDRDANKG